jgi:hypothetical protein
MSAFKAFYDEMTVIIVYDSYNIIRLINHRIAQPPRAERTAYFPCAALLWQPHDNHNNHPLPVLAEWLIIEAKILRKCFPQIALF